MKLTSIGAFTLALACVGCAGTYSTIDEGFAYKMPQTNAEQVVQGAIKSHIVNDRILENKGLIASGYARSIIDTQTYTVSAIPVPNLNAFGFEVNHHGTMANGPAKARQIYRSVINRAEASGEKTSIR